MNKKTQNNLGRTASPSLTQMIRLYQYLLTLYIDFSDAANNWYAVKGGDTLNLGKYPRACQKVGLYSSSLYCWVYD